MSKILIIEDEESLSDMYRLRLEKEGYQIFTASRGKQGIEIAKKEQPDLILLDIVMPEMDGYEVLEKLKSDNKTKNLRVFFLTNMGQDEEIKRGMDLGAESYIIKSSLTPSALVLRLQEKLGIQSSAITKENKNIVSGDKKDELGVQSCKGVRLLMIEDNEAIIDMYKLRLEKEGVIVEVAKNGAWGLKAAEKGIYDIILLDMVMPALHGLETIKVLKKNSKTANIPVLVFSNSAQEGDMKEAKAAGAENYFIKSDITPATLIREIKKYCPVVLLKKTDS
ncbi:MAG: response regulator [Patescibacteria group bacterium]|jgi:CheY-like chemotaxis protein